MTSKDVQNSLSGQILDACAELRGSSQPLNGMENESMQIGTNYVNSSNRGASAYFDFFRDRFPLSPKSTARLGTNV